MISSNEFICMKKASDKQPDASGQKRESHYPADPSDCLIDSHGIFN
jgi:hypothetical protein